MAKVWQEREAEFLRRKHEVFKAWLDFRQLTKASEEAEEFRRACGKRLPEVEAARVKIQLGKNGEENLKRLDEFIKARQR